MVATATVTSSTLLSQTKKAEPASPRGPALESDLVRRIVLAAHSEIEEVKSLLEQDPKLSNATWDWGSGDFETPLGSASHMGRTDIAQILIKAGARKDLFYYAMEGNFDVLRPAVTSDQSVVDVLGPHGISLFFHSAISGNVPLAAFLLENGGIIDNGSLNASVLYGRSYEMTKWLLERGAVYYGQTGFGKDPLAKWARSQGMKQIADLLDEQLQPSAK